MPDAPIVPPTEEAHGAIGSNPPNAPVNTTPRLHQIHPPVLATALDLLGRFVSSGVFFMIIGAVLLRTAYETIGTTHSAMSFVFVVMGVAILLFGTGTQGIGRLDTGEDATRVVKYQVALAGGAGVIAFCIAAGMIAFPAQIKSAFLPTQTFIRILVEGNGLPEEISNYYFVATVNSARVPTVLRDDHVEILAPYLPTPLDTTLHVVVNSHLTDVKSTRLLPYAESKHDITLTDQTILVDGSPQGSYRFDDLDFPQYRMRDKLKIISDNPIVGGISAQ